MSATTPEHFHERLFRLLGKRLAKDSVERLISDLISELGDTPAKLHGRTTDSYDFDRSGIGLDFDKELGFFTNISLCIFTASIEAGNTSPYYGSLPFGIVAADSREEIKKKIPSATTSTGDDQLEVDMAPLNIQVRFRWTDSEPGRQRLSMISAVYSQNSARSFS
jgi:hypothetical protein